MTEAKFISQMSTLDIMEFIFSSSFRKVINKDNMYKLRVEPVRSNFGEIVAYNILDTNHKTPEKIAVLTDFRFVILPSTPLTKEWRNFMHKKFGKDYAKQYNLFLHEMGKQLAL